MTLGMAQSYPVQCRVVAWRTRLTRCAYPMLCDDAGLVRETGIQFVGILPGLKKFHETRKKTRKSGNFSRNAKKHVRLITTLSCFCV